MNKSLHFSLTILIVLSCLFSNNTFAQTTLGLGEIAFTGYLSEVPTGTDEISFILLKPIEEETTISFTDNGWLETGGFRTIGPGASPELVMTWTADAAYPCGTQIHLFPNSNGSFDQDGAVAGTLVNPDLSILDNSNTNPPAPNTPFILNLETGGDQLFAFQGPLPTATDMSGFLSAIAVQLDTDWQTTSVSNNTSALPSVFTDGVNSVFINAGAVATVGGASYTCGPPQLVAAGETPQEVAAMINNPDNWSTVDLEIPAPCSFEICCTVIESIVSTEASCNEADGTATIVATICSFEGSYTITGPVTMTNTTGVFTGLPMGNYIATVEDTVLPEGTCTDSQAFVVEGEIDVEPPMVLNALNPITGLSCGDLLPSAPQNAADFIAMGGLITDNCTAVEDLLFFTQVSTVGDFCNNSNPYTITRTFIIFDGAGNSTTSQQTVSYVEDAAAPVITSVAPTCYKYCGYQANPSMDDISYEASCNGDANVNIEGPEVIGQENCPGTIMRYTYTVVDDCGQSSVPVTRDFIVGNNGPTVTAAPFNLILECGNPNNQAYINTHLGITTANSSCGVDVTISHFPQSFNLVTCGIATVVTFVATDACGRTATATTTIAVQDNTAPTFTQVPPSVCDVIECGADANYWFDHWIDYMVTGLVATDNCDNNVSISALSPQLNTSCGADGNAISVVSFAATDNCGNSSVMTGTFTIENTSPALFTDIPASATINCSQTLSFGTPELAEECQTTLSFADATDNTNPCAVNYTRTWTATDACGGLTATASQTITVIDNDVPQFTNTPADATITCDEAVSFGMPTATDNCANPTMDFVDAQSGMGCSIMYTRTWTATDACGNTATFSQTITAVDNEGPEFSNTPADATIACGGTVTFGMPTVTDACTDATMDFVDTQTGTGCNIVYTRTWTATDDCGNTATFSQNITTSDTEAPHFDMVPGDYTGPCVDANGMVTAYAQICSSSDDAEEDKEDGDEGKMNLTSSDLELVLDDSQSKNVEVGLRFKDLNIPAGAQITAAHIQFYADATIDVDPSSLTIHGEDSDNALTFTTEDFNISDRPKTSAAVDWEPGDWQVIGDNHEVERSPDLAAIVQEIVDGTGYTTQSALAFFINGTGKRTAIAYDLNPDQAPQLYVTYQAATDAFGMATATDNCGNANITFSDVETGDCAGSKVRTWIATDDCGNSSTATQTLNFTDNIPPVFTFVPEHLNGDCDTITFPPTFGDPVVVDNCDVNTNITFTDFFYEGDTTSCTNEVDYDYRRLWVATDACGNSTTAVQRFNINGTDYSSLSGFIFTEEEAPVEEVEVSLEGFNGFNMMSMSQGNGTFGYNGLEYGSNYTVAPKSNHDPLNGISTYDIVLMSRHILQLEALDSPYKIIAADINKSGSVTTFDMVELRKMILLINEEFPDNNSWRFVESDYMFPDPSNPFSVIFPEETFINGLVEGSEHNYVGIKVGDVNNTAIPNSLMQVESRSPEKGITLLMDDQTLEAGEEHEVIVRAEDFETITGFQFALNFDASRLEFVDLSPAMLPQLGAQNFGLTKVNEGRVVTSWNHKEAQSFDADEALFALTFRAKAALRLSEVLSMGDRISAEAYDSALDLKSVDLRFEGDVDLISNNEYTLYQNQPNPFKTNTTIGFELPTETTATISFYDLSGRLVKEISNDFPKGYNEITVDKSDLKGNGVLYYRLLTSEFEATKKMMIVE